MSNVIVAVNEAFLNTLLFPYRGFFDGTQIIKVLGLEAVYTATQDPYFELSPHGHRNHDFILHVPVLALTLYRYTSRTRGAEVLTRRFSLAFYGSFTLNDATDDAPASIGLKLGHADVTGAPISKRLMGLALNQTIIPAIMAQLPRVILPDMRALLGFPVEFHGLQVANRLLFMRLHVPQGGEATPSPITTQTDAPSIFLSATDAAITATQTDFKLKAGLDDDTDFPLPSGVKLGIASAQIVGYMAADNFRLRVQGGQPTCAIRLSAAGGLKLGLKPLGKLNLTLQPTITPPRFSLRLLQDADTLYAAVQMDSSPLVSWAIPGTPDLLKPLLRDLLAGVDSAMSVVYDTVDSGLRLMQIPLISLASAPFAGTFHAARFNGNGVFVHIILQ